MTIQQRLLDLATRFTPTKLCYLLPLLAFTILLSACATFSRSGEVIVRSEPLGAQVFVVNLKNGRASLIGETPLRFQKAEHKDKDSEIIQLRIEKEGYRSKSPSVASFGDGTSYLDVRLMANTVAKKEITDSFEKLRILRTRMNQLVLANRYSEALAESQGILDLDPKNAEAFAAKGSILFLMKDREGAQRAWLKALELNPDFDSVRASLIGLNLESENGRKPASQEENSP